MLAGAAVIVAGLALWWPWLAAGAALAVAAYCVQAVPASRRTLRWSRSITVARPPDEVLAFVSDLERTGELMAPRFYPEQNQGSPEPAFGVLKTERTGTHEGRTEYRQFTANQGGPVLSVVMRVAVDAARGEAVASGEVGGRAEDRFTVRRVTGGSELTYASEMTIPYWSGGLAVSLFRGGQEAAAGRRLEGLLGRVKAALEGSAAPA